MVLRDWSATGGIYSVGCAICLTSGPEKGIENWDCSGYKTGFNTGMDEICKRFFPLCQNILLELKTSKQNVLTLPNLDPSLCGKASRFRRKSTFLVSLVLPVPDFSLSPIITSPLNIFMMFQRGGRISWAASGKASVLLVEGF